MGLLCITNVHFTRAQGIHGNHVIELPCNLPFFIENRLLSELELGGPEPDGSVTGHQVATRDNILIYNLSLGPPKQADQAT